MKKLLYSVLILVLTMILLTLSIGAQVSYPEPEFNFVHASLNPPTHADYPINLDFINRVEKLSNGRIKYEYFHSSVLGDEHQVMEAMQLGAITTSKLGAPNLGAYLDGYIAVSLPFIFSSPDHMFRVLRSPEFAKITEDELNEIGLRTLDFRWEGYRDVYTKKPVHNIKDLKGMKIRTTEATSVINIWKAFGAIPTPIPMSDLYNALQTGMVDGGEGYVESYNARSYYEHAPYVSKINYVCSVGITAISERIWQQLPSDLQDVIKQAAIENSEFAYQSTKDSNEKMYETARGKGATVIEVEDIEEWRNRVEPIYENFGEIYGQKYADFINFVKSTK